MAAPGAGVGADDGLAVVAVSESFLSTDWHLVADLKLRLRHHVQIRRHRYRGVPWYVIHDELAGRQHRLSAAAWLFAGLLDGRRTVDEAWHATVERQGENAPTQNAAMRTLAQLHAGDLLQGDRPAGIEALLERGARQRRAALIGRFGNPLSMRIRIGDPDWFLTRTAHLVRPLFTPLGACLWLLLVIPALAVAVTNWPSLSHDVIDRILARQGLLAVALLYPLTKLVHELGHGWAVKRWGGAVHEIGVMLMVLYPMPYIDASTASTFRGRTSRVVVGAAGMLAELALAALATLLWQVIEPGPVRAACYTIMVTAGIGTVLFNANPLMRLDGYYILTDLLEMPNLAQRSARFWRRLAQRALWGPNRSAELLPEGAELFCCAIYAPLSLAYRITVTLAIAGLIASRYFYAGAAIALLGLIRMLLWPAAKGLWHVLTAPAPGRSRARACAVLFASLACLSGCLFAIPLPVSSAAEGVVWLPEASVVRATEAGEIAGLLARPGDRVHAGQELFRLTDPELADSVPLAEAQVAGLEARLAAERFDHRVEAAITAQELAYKRANLAQLQARERRLVVSAGTDGTLVAPMLDDLPSKYAKRGDVLGFVTPSGNRIVRVVVGQNDVDLVRTRLVGAELLVPGHAAVALAARVVREVPAASERLPSAALGDAGGGAIASDPRDENRTRALQSVFTFDLESTEAAVPDFGQRVLVRFDYRREPLGLSLYRRLRQLMLSRFDA